MGALIIPQRQDELARIKSEAAGTNSILALRQLVADLADEVKRLKDHLKLS